MRTFYVRPDSPAGYGRGDGTSYDNAWNGFKSVDWNALRGEPSTLWVCGESTANAPTGFVTLHIEWSYLNDTNDEARPHPRRESPLPV